MLNSYWTMFLGAKSEVFHYIEVDVVTAYRDFKGNPPNLLKCSRLGSRTEHWEGPFGYLYALDPMGVAGIELSLPHLKHGWELL